MEVVDSLAGNGASDKVVSTSSWSERRILNLPFSHRGNPVFELFRIERHLLPRSTAHYNIDHIRRCQKHKRYDMGLKRYDIAGMYTISYRL